MPIPTLNDPPANGFYRDEEKQRLVAFSQGKEIASVTFGAPPEAVEHFTRMIGDLLFPADPAVLIEFISESFKHMPHPESWTNAHPDA